MTLQFEIQTPTNGVIKKTSIKCKRVRDLCSLCLITDNGEEKSYIAHDYYICLGLARADLPETKFLCKGAKLNVHPSRMSSQMSSGIVAYEIKSGVPTEPEDMVRIFDYEDSEITNDIQKQHEFYRSWIKSLGFDVPDGAKNENPLDEILIGMKLS